MKNKKISHESLSYKYLNEEKIKSKNAGGDIQKYINASQSVSTKRAYASDLRHFLAHGGRVPCKPKRLGKYLAESANNGLAVATLERRLTAIHKAHLDHKFPSPAHSEIVKQVMQGIRRTLGTKQRQARPLMKNDLVAVLMDIENKQMPIKAARDQALLLIGFASAMRRSELVGVRMDDLKFVSEGFEVFLPFSKTDQERNGRYIVVPYAAGIHCPVIALKKWLKLSKISDGYLFRSVNRYDGVGRKGLSPQSVSLILKAAMLRIGANANDISAHSLRAGYCTTAVAEGISSWKIRAQTGHKSEMTLAKYIRVNEMRKTASLL